MTARPFLHDSADNADPMSSDRIIGCKWHPRAALCRTGFAVVAAMLMMGCEAFAQPAPDTENGRYTLSPVSDGFLRLDTRNGVVSICTNKNGWVCRLVADERAALDTEIGRLQADNKQLREQLAQRDTASGKTGGESGKSAQAPSDSKASPDRKIELQLPPEHEKLLALIDRVWDRLIEMAVRLQKRLSEKI